LALKALQFEHLTMSSFPQAGQLNFTKLSLAKMFTLQVLHFSIKSL